MKYVFFSDIHGNIIAFQNFIKQLEIISPEKVYFLGDVLGYFPDGESIIKEIRDRSFICLKGNHEAMLLGELPVKQNNDQIYRLMDFYSSLSEADKEWIQSLPSSVSITLNDKSFKLIHGSLEMNIDGYTYEDSQIDHSLLEEDFLVVGNTHRGFVKKEGDKTILNLGSVGLPRDGKGSSFGVFDDVKKTFELMYFDSQITDQIKHYSGKVHESVITCLQRNIHGKN